MESPGSDDERLRQENEAAISKKMKILIIMLSLVLMILLLPLASDHGLPLLRPMGTSLLQRLWDAMRFIAMTAAISVGIISTSNSHKNNKKFEGSSHVRSSSSFRRPSTAPIIAGSSREASNPDMAKNINRYRSSPSSLHSTQHVDADDDFQPRVSNTQKFKGKEVMDDTPSSATTNYSETHLDSVGRAFESVQSSREFIEEDEDYEGFKHKPLKLNMVNSRHQYDARFLASRIDEEVEEGPMASAGYMYASSRSRGESSMGRVDAQKNLFTGHGKEWSSKSSKSADKGLTNVYNSMMDDNYAEVRMRRTAVSRLAEDNHDEKGKGHRRSSSVDRRRYIYDQPSPDQPGLKQILMEMSKERASKFKMPDPDASSNQAYNANQRVVERPTHTQVKATSNSNAVASMSSIKANVQHQQASVVSTIKFPSDLTAIEKHADAKVMGIDHKLQEAMKVGSNQNLQKGAGAGKMGADAGKIGSIAVDQSKQGNEIKAVSNEIGLKQANANKGANQNMQQKQAEYSKMGSRQKQIGAARVGSSTQQTAHREGDAKAKMGSDQTLQKQADVKMGSTQTLNAKGSTQIQNIAKLASEGGNTQRQHEGPQPVLHKSNRSSTSKLLKQSSQHSRSALNLKQLGQADESQARPPIRSSARGRKSFSYDFGDGFSPDWLMELEPPPPPGLLGSPTEEAQQSSHFEINAEVKDTDNSSLLQSLVPWRSSAPIDISAYPRAATPPGILSQATGPSPGEVTRRAEEFIINFNTRLIRQRQESLERQRR